MGWQGLLASGLLSPAGLQALVAALAASDGGGGGGLGAASVAPAVPGFGAVGGAGQQVNPVGLAAAAQLDAGAAGRYLAGLPVGVGALGVCSGICQQGLMGNLDASTNAGIVQVLALCMSPHRLCIDALLP